ncbi:hypothetical protein [Ferruginibacter sp.]
MKKTFILLAFFFLTAPLFSQEYRDPADSIVKSTRLSGDDWIIGLSVSIAGGVEMYDSLGNKLYESGEGFYTLSMINKQTVLKKFEYYYPENSYHAKLKLKRNLNISDNNICHYTKDSIEKAANEWICPNIYSITTKDSIKVYSVQQNADHAPVYDIWLRTMDSSGYSHFGHINLFDFHFPPQLEADFFHENLNLKYNTSTFIYRALINYFRLLEKYFNVRSLEKFY